MPFSAAIELAMAIAVEMAAELLYFCFYFLVAGGNKGGSWAALLLKVV